MTEIYINLLIGFLFGLMTASLGAWKDTRYEGFSLLKFFRSPVITALCMPFAHALGMDQFFAMFCERLITETWKTFIRPRKPGKFK